MTTDALWKALQHEATAAAKREPALRPLLEECFIQAGSLQEGLSIRLVRKLAYHSTPESYLRETFSEVFRTDDQIIKFIVDDIQAVKDRDPACQTFLCPVLNFKGFQSLTCYRIAHALWKQERYDMALYLQSLISEVFAVDIHPAARIGGGILLDHATGFVAGETAVIGDNVSILHQVTLGGTGKASGDRHPKVGSGVLIGAGAKILGNVKIGDGAKIGANSVVLTDIPEHSTAVGIPAKIVGVAPEDQPALYMDHNFC